MRDLTMRLFDVGGGAIAFYGWDAGITNLVDATTVFQQILGALMMLLGTAGVLIMAVSTAVIIMRKAMVAPRTHAEETTADRHSQLAVEQP